MGKTAVASLQTAEYHFGATISVVKGDQGMKEFLICLGYLWPFSLQLRCYCEKMSLKHRVAVTMIDGTCRRIISLAARSVSSFHGMLTCPGDQHTQILDKRERRS